MISASGFGRSGRKKLTATDDRVSHETCPHGVSGLNTMAVPLKTTQCAVPQLIQT